MSAKFGSTRDCGTPADQPCLMDGHPCARAIDPPTQIGHTFNGRVVRAGFQPPLRIPVMAPEAAIGNPFPHVEWQPNHATTTRLHLGRQLGQLGMITLKVDELFHHPGGVHQHSSGSHPLLEPQNGDQPFGVNDRQSECKRVAEVPKLMTTTPGAAAPAPMVIIMLSPPPAATGVPSAARPRRLQPKPARPTALPPKEAIAARGPHQSWPPARHQRAASRQRTPCPKVAGPHRLGG